jgi:hypothetical protein
MTHRRILELDPPQLDLRKHQFWDQKHGMHIVGSWWLPRESRKRFTPCLALLPTNRPIRAGRSKPVVIFLADAWKWAMHSDVGDPEHCVERCKEWTAEGLLPGDPHNKASHMRIVDAINSRLPDLIAMPPMPPMMGQSFTLGEVTITDKNTGAIIREGEISRNV